MANPTIIVQARMRSGRLPGKVMLPLAGHEVLWHDVMRCKQSKKAKNIVVATSTDMSDDIIEAFCKQHGFSVFRGELGDVLTRYYECARTYTVDPIMRVTADCPLIDPFIIDETFEAFETAGTEYLSNTLHRTFPIGLDCEVFSFGALERAYHKASQPSEREHVTPFIMTSESTAIYEMPKAYQGPYRLTLDEERDYELLQNIYDKFYRENEIIDVRRVIQYLAENPEIARINASVEQKS